MSLWVGGSPLPRAGEAYTIRRVERYRAGHVTAASTSHWNDADSFALVKVMDGSIPEKWDNRRLMAWRFRCEHS